MTWSLSGGPNSCLLNWLDSGLGLGEAVGGTYGEHDGNSTADRPGSVQLGLLAHEELFLAIGKFPGRDGCAVEVDSDGFAGGESGFDGVFAEGDGGLRQGRADADSRGFVGAIHLD